MSDTFECIIESIEKPFYKGQVKKVNLPTFDGDVCILADHINYLSYLKSGEIIIDGIKKINVEKGYAHFMNNVCRIWIFD